MQPRFWVHCSGLPMSRWTCARGALYSIKAVFLQRVSAVESRRKRTYKQEHLSLARPSQTHSKTYLRLHERKLFLWRVNAGESRVRKVFPLLITYQFDLYTEYKVHMHTESPVQRDSTTCTYNELCTKIAKHIQDGRAPPSSICLIRSNPRASLLWMLMTLSGRMWDWITMGLRSHPAGCVLSTCDMAFRRATSATWTLCHARMVLRRMGNSPHKLQKSRSADTSAVLDHVRNIGWDELVALYMVGKRWSNSSMSPTMWIIHVQYGQVHSWLA